MWKLGTPESQQTAPAASSQPHSGGFQLHTFLLPQKESCRLRPLEISHTDPPKQAPKPPESQGTYRLPLGMKVILKQTRSSRLPSPRAGNLGDWRLAHFPRDSFRRSSTGSQRAASWRSPQRCQELSCASGPDPSPWGPVGGPASLAASLSSAGHSCADRALTKPARGELRRQAGGAQPGMPQAGPHSNRARS